jgi:hypothetical protein
MPFEEGGLTRTIMVSLAQLSLLFLPSYSNEEVKGVRSGLRSGGVRLGNLVASAGKQNFVKNLKFLCLSAIL